MVATLRALVSMFTCCIVASLISGYVGEDLAINLWDLGSGKRIKKMTGHLASIYSLAFSAESSLLVSGSADWTVRCWDVKSSGGLKGKLRENGGSPRLGIANNEAPRSYGEAENLET
jgi:transcription initiation factor TFIID subunit 5